MTVAAFLLSAALQYSGGYVNDRSAVSAVFKPSAPEFSVYRLTRTFKIDESLIMNKVIDPSKISGKLGDWETHDHYPKYMRRTVSHELEGLTRLASFTREKRLVEYALTCKGANQPIDLFDVWLPVLRKELGRPSTSYRTDYEGKVVEGKFEFNVGDPSPNTRSISWMWKLRKGVTQSPDLQFEVSLTLTDDVDPQKREVSLYIGFPMYGC
jgi:hypothetical protein